jgi:hypothetical protein
VPRPPQSALVRAKPGTKGIQQINGGLLNAFCTKCIFNPDDLRLVCIVSLFGDLHVLCAHNLVMYALMQGPVMF